ncbi:putative malate dehydrogenase [Operophtera brumata]|uniref:Malate dehydrogenase, mitochondrial n=1 Tax=Operophtera brumata TaxID=104452 RepID=A0A0L7LL53_OPEBR|nr:putative malate dehydrogenase [Operophtera brumata]
MWDSLTMAWKHCIIVTKIGQPLALLLKQCPLLDEIALYDICPTCGYGMELSHVDTKCKVSSFSGRHMLCDALMGAKVVVIVARNLSDTFENSAPILTEIALQICNVCPTPVESMVPLVGEIQRLRSLYNPRTLLGCVELNCVRANTALADFLRAPPEAVRVPIECVTSCIMGGTEAVCAAKGCCTETASLAGAYAVARTTINVVKGLMGQKNIVQCAYVDSLGDCAPGCQFFASEICREMTCKCGTTELCWRPREADYDAARASNFTHQMPTQSGSCTVCRLPRSVRIEQVLRDRANDPCTS